MSGITVVEEAWLAYVGTEYQLLSLATVIVKTENQLICDADLHIHKTDNFLQLYIKYSSKHNQLFLLCGRFGLYRRSKRQGSKNNWLCFDEVLI